MTIEKFFENQGNKVTYNSEVQTIHTEHGDNILEVTGWSTIANYAKTNGEAEDLQNGLGEWIADAINQKLFPSSQKEVSDGWILCDKELPSTGIKYWVCVNWTYIHEAYYGNNEWRDWETHDILSFVNHWRKYERPEPPKQEQK